MVILENSVLQALTRNPQAVASFPFLRGLQVVSGRRCGSCSRRDRQAFNEVRQQIATLDAAGRQRLKGLLGADSVRVLLPDGKSLEF